MSSIAPPVPLTLSVVLSNSGTRVVTILSLKSPVDSVALLVAFLYTRNAPAVTTRPAAIAAAPTPKVIAVFAAAALAARDQLSAVVTTVTALAIICAALNAISAVEMAATAVPTANKVPT